MSNYNHKVYTSLRNQAIIERIEVPNLFFELPNVSGDSTKNMKYCIRYAMKEVSNQGDCEITSSKN